MYPGLAAPDHILLPADAAGLVGALALFAHLTADTIVNGSATSHLAPTDHADRECHVWMWWMLGGGGGQVCSWGLFWGWLYQRPLCWGLDMGQTLFRGSTVPPAPFAPLPDVPSPPVPLPGPRASLCSWEQIYTLLQEICCIPLIPDIISAAKGRRKRRVAGLGWGTPLPCEGASTNPSSPQG